MDPMPRELTRGQRAAADKARLRAEEKRLTQRDLAELLGISEKGVWKFFNHQAWPQGRTLAGYERSLGWMQGYLSEVAARYDADLQVLDDASPEERKILELVQELRLALDEVPVSSHSQKVTRDLRKLTAQLVELGGGRFQNVRPLKLRPVAEIDAEIERELELRDDTLSSDVPGAQAIVAQVHDPKIAALRAEREITVTHTPSNVAES